MTKSILALVCLALAPTQLIAQSTDSKYFITRQECTPLAEMMNTVVNNYGETALFTGEGLVFAPDGTPYRGGAMFLVNQDTGSWSLITLYGDGTACMTAVGIDFEPFGG